MTAATIHTNLVSAFRQRLKTLSKATTGATSAISVAGGIYTRSSGSFLADGFGIGDEIMASGFVAAANNGRAMVTAVNATTMTVTGRTLVNVAAGPAITIVAGLPQGRAWETESYTPTIGQPYVTDEYIPVTSRPVGIGTNGVQAHWVQGIVGLWYPTNGGRLAPSMMAGAIMSLYKPGSPLSYSGEGGMLLEATPSRIIVEPHWLNINVVTRYVAHTTG